MKAFAALFRALDQTTATSAKVAALALWFATAPEADRLWTLALFTGRRPRRAVTTTALAQWAAQVAGLPQWLFDDCYTVAGDLAETIALILPPPGRPLDQPLSVWIAGLQRLATKDDAARRAAVLAAWDGLNAEERFLYNKLLTGGFRVGVSRGLILRALAQATGRPQADLTHRLMGQWTPDTTSWAALIHQPDSAAADSRPYPFALAHPLADLADLGDPDDLAGWLAEMKWDGIRGQLILRGGTHYLWSRGEELITAQFPELARALDWLPPGTVLDGEIIAWGQDRPLPFAALQPRIGRRAPSRKVLAQVPVVLMAYDLLESGGQDLRADAFSSRRAMLAALIAPLPAAAPLRLSPLYRPAGHAALSALRDGAAGQGAEGLMLKSAASPYHIGRKAGGWWKWKRDPFLIDVVMVYAQAGHGRRADLFTDYTFAVRDGDGLAPVAKAYSGLTDAEFVQITAWVRANTLQRFGPVRQVRPELVFEIAFDGLQPSPRHKAGLALRFPRMARWRRDKPADEIDTLDALRALLAQSQ